MQDAPLSRVPPAPVPVVVTGCSSGIGLATALGLARAGYTVVATVKSLDEQGTLREDARAAGLPIDIIPLDITSELSTREAIQYLRMKYGKLRALVNNAGVGSGGFFEDLSDEEVRELFEVNFFGTARFTRLAIPLLRAAQSSHLITISSLAGRIGVPAMSIYHASKFALEGLFECLYYELRPHGVRVTLIEPGLIRTPIMKTGFKLAKKFDDPSSPNRDRAAKLWTGFQARFERTAQPPSIVADAIERLLRTEDPGLHCPVGLDARIILWVHKVLPEWLFYRLWRRFAG